jgi:hypothetical protein
MPQAISYPTTFLDLPASAGGPEPEQSELPRKGLRGYRCAYGTEPGSGSGLDEDTATPAERARFRRDQARQMLVLARDKVRLAYAATRRFRRDQRWGRVDCNPEALGHLATARTALNSARIAVILAAAAEGQGRAAP